MSPLLTFFALTAILQQPAPAPAADTLPPVALQECTGKCPEGVRPPRFKSFPDMGVLDAIRAGVDVDARRSRTFLLFQGIVGADGILEADVLEMVGGTARGMEADFRRGLMQARFEPARRGDVPVRARVTLRFDFEAEGTWVKHTYRVTAR